MTYVVVVADSMDEQGLDLLRQEPDFEVVTTVGDPDRLPEAMQRAHALLVRSATQVTEELIMNAPSLRVVGRAGIGVDNIDIEAATRRGIAVVNAPGANTVSAAEHAIAILLALVRRVPWAVRSMREGKWDRNLFRGTELRGKVLGLIGLGRIGAHVAGIARAFGMEVLACDPFLSPEQAKRHNVTLSELDSLLQRADVVSLHVPLTDDTRHILNAERLALLRPTAVVINTARGGLIDIAALLEALRENRLAGAALDVFEQEPLAEDSPLRWENKVLLTPHLAASTDEAQIRVSVEICRTVLAALRTGDVGGAVNVPGVSSVVLVRARAQMELARRLAQLAAVLAGSPVRAIEVDYGGHDEEAPRPVMIAAIEGVLRGAGVGPVTLVNARMLAEERDITVHRRVGRPNPGFETTVAVTVESADDRATVLGGVRAGDTDGRIIRIEGLEVDIPTSGHLLMLRNSDGPDVTDRVQEVLGEVGVTVGSYRESAERNGGAVLAAVTVDVAPAQEVLERIEALAGVTDVRLVRLGDPD
ncbi:MAG: phosphoglycerate dehydrogenase [Gemmatimonadetes bacterium]|nr:phosphoglycerate dehydrogenase [Gemmatimonadota bacterium]